MSTGPPPTDGILFYGETGVVAGIAALAVARLWRLSMPVDAVALTVLTALGLAAVMAAPRNQASRPTPPLAKRSRIQCRKEFIASG